MPIFVQWKWDETRKSFLVVFHFYNDFSKPNLRIRKYSPVLVTYEDEGITNSFMAHHPLELFFFWYNVVPRYRILANCCICLK
jgi:hypothetical protein